MTNTPIWDDSAPLGLPTLEGDHHTDVCVVGLGGSGLAAVHELLAMGRQVIGIDAGMVASGAAGRNGGFLLAGPADFHHDAIRNVGRERAVELYRQTLHEIDRMESDTPDLIRRDGSLRVAENEAELADCRLQLEAMRADGLPAEWYRGPEGEGLRIETDGVFQPLARCRRMAALALSSGAQLFEHSAALEITGRAVTTHRGRIECRRVLVLIDGNLENVIPELQGRVRTARLQMLATEPTTAVRSRFAVYSRWGFEYWQQLDDGRVALGGFRDKAGEGEWTNDARPTEPVQSMLDEYLRNDLGIFEPVTHRWAGLTAFTGDGMPIVEEVRPGVWVGGGYSGTGNVVGQIVGRRLAREEM